MVYLNHFSFDLFPQVISFVCLLIGFLILYHYFNFLREKELFWRRVNRLRGKNPLTLKNTSISRFEFWLRKIYLIGLRDIFQRLSVDAAKRYRLRFQQAGWNPQDAFLKVSIINSILIILSTLLYITLLFNAQSFSQMSFFLKFMIFLLIIFISLRGFEYYVDFVIHNRYLEIQRGFSYSIDLMTICARSGFSLGRSFAKIAEEMAQYNPTLCKEFAQTAIELAVIPERNTALHNLADRVNVPIVHVLVSGLIQAEEQGTPLSYTLHLMSVEFTKQKMLDIEEKAARLPALLTIPVIAFLMPATLIILLGPAANNIIKSSIYLQG